LAATIVGAYSGLIIQELCDPVNVDSGKLVSRFLAVVHQGLYSAVEDLDKDTESPNGPSTNPTQDVSTTHLSEERKRAQS